MTKKQYIHSLAHTVCLPRIKRKMDRFYISTHCVLTQKWRRKQYIHTLGHVGVPRDYPWLQDSLVHTNMYKFVRQISSTHSFCSFQNRSQTCTNVSTVPPLMLHYVNYLHHRVINLFSIPFHRTSVAFDFTGNKRSLPFNRASIAFDLQLMSYPLNPSVISS